MILLIKINSDKKIMTGMINPDAAYRLLIILLIHIDPTMKKFVFTPSPINPELESVTPYTANRKTSFLRSYFDKIESSFQEESILLWEECKLENERTKEHDDDSEYDFRASDSLQEIEFIYLRMHRYSAILASYAYLESSMMKLCNELDLKVSPEPPLKETKGEGIEKCKTYFSRTTGVNFTEINTEWSQVATLNKIRNCIIHADGDSSRMKKRQQLIDIIHVDNDLSLIENNLVMVSSNFIHRSIDNIKTVLVYMYNSMK